MVGVICLISLSAGLPLAAQAESDKETAKPEFRILGQVNIRQGGRNISMREVAPPIFPKEEAATALQPQREPITIEPEADIEYHSVTVSATVYDRKWTFLRVHHFTAGASRVTEAWSNVDWNYLGGFASFAGRGQYFTFLMLSGNSSIEDLRKANQKDPNISVPVVPQKLPDLASAGPCYMPVVQTKDEDETALEFLESIHDLYAEKQAELIAAYEERERQRLLRQEEMRLNPPKPKDIEVQFWDNNINK